MSEEYRKISIPHYKMRGMTYAACSFSFIFLLPTFIYILINYCEFIGTSCYMEYFKINVIFTLAIFIIAYLFALLVFMSVYNFLRSRRGYERAVCPQCCWSTLVRKGDDLQCHKCWGVLTNEIDHYTVKRKGDLEHSIRHEQYAFAAWIFTVFCPLPLFPIKWVHAMLNPASDVDFNMTSILSCLFVLMSLGSGAALFFGWRSRRGRRPEPSCPPYSPAALEP